MMLVQALRLHLAEGAKRSVGWFFALADRRMSAAIGAMHQDPAHRWTLQVLAARAGMSRTSFAVKFKKTVGVSPLDDLTRWRMLLAGDRLVNADQSVSVIALSPGYESESAFSTAFKRVMGRSPRQYGRGQGPSGRDDGRAMRTPEPAPRRSTIRPQGGEPPRLAEIPANLSADPAAGSHLVPRDDDLANLSLHAQVERTFDKLSAPRS